jgi:hypothetical protein
VLAATGEPWVSGGDEPSAGWLAAGGLELAGGSGASVRWQPQLDWSCDTLKRESTVIYGALVSAASFT